MNDEPKSAAELKEIRLNRKRTQEVEGIKAMAEIAAADVAIRKRTEKLRALRLAKEAADRENPPEQRAFQALLFSKIVPNCKKLGLLDAADGWLRTKFTELGVIAFEDWADTGEEYAMFQLAEGEVVSQPA